MKNTNSTKLCLVVETTDDLEGHVGGKGGSNVFIDYSVSSHKKIHNTT